MTVTYKILGQSSPSSGIVTTLYTVPSATSGVISSVVVCNRDATTSTFNIAVVKSGSTLADKDYIYCNLTLLGNDSFVANLGITLAAGDFISIASSSDNLSFNLFGTEIT